MPSKQPSGGEALDASVLTGALLVGQGLFQAGLAAGKPWGRMAYGGQNPGVLPTAHRRVSATAAVCYVTAGLGIAGGAGSPRSRRAVLTGVTALMGVGVVVNAVSRSPAERVWSPYCAITATAAWRARPPATDQ